MESSYARKLFGTAAIFNGAAGLPILLAGGQVSALFGLPPPASLLFSQIAGMAVLLFGIGYWMEARRPGENRAVVAIGMIGKIGIFVIAAGHLAVGSVNWVLPALAAVDISYAYLFFRYLSATKQRGNPH